MPDNIIETPDSGKRRSKRRRTSRFSEDLSELDNVNASSNITKKPKCNRKQSIKTETPIVVDFDETPKPKVKKPPCSFSKFYANYNLGLNYQQYKRPVKDIIINYCTTLKLYKVESPFDRRVTFLVWHPTNPRVLCVTSHGGDFVLYDYEQDMSQACIIKGIGAGGSVQGMKFDPLNPIQIYTVSMEGKFLVLNFQTKEAKQFLETNDINRWYVSVDVCPSTNMMVAGDTRGGLTMLTMQGMVIDTLKLHKTGCKITNVEFSKRDPWLLCTSSTDKTVKMWDVRNMKSESMASPNSKGQIKPVVLLKQEKPINAAYFSLTDGCRLLTTDQFDKISVYRAPLWNLETLIHHPHRQFQHLTPIKAYWHPLEDIIFVGRYPHNKFPGYHKNELRTLDFFDAETGDLLYQHSQSGLNGILPLNRFNANADALASGYGRQFLIWRPNFKQLDRISKIEDKVRKEIDAEPVGDGRDDFDWKAFLKKKGLEKKITKKKGVEKG